MLLFAYKQSIAVTSAQVTVTASPCVINTGDNNKTLTFDDILPVAAASRLQTIRIPLAVNGCPASISQVRLTFYGQPDTTDPDKTYANTGTARNVAIELVTSSATPVGNGKSAGLTVQNGSTTFLLDATLLSRGNVTSGTIQSVVTAEMSYL